MRIQPINSLSYKNKHRQISNNIHFNGKLSPLNPNKITPIISRYFFPFAVLFSTCTFGYEFFTTLDEKSQYVTPSQSDFATKEDAIKYAKERIAKHLNAKNPVEYGVTIEIKNNKYKILSENLGDSASVYNLNSKIFLKNFLKMNYTTIRLHGHPKDNDPPRHIGTQTFSFKDFKNLNEDYTCIEAIVINKDMQHCSLKKKENFIPLNESDLASVEKDFNDAFNSSWSNEIPIIKDGEVIGTFRDYQYMHKFWDDVAKKYNLEYSTTYGVFDGIDAYQNGYYPEIKPAFFEQ